MEKSKLTDKKMGNFLFLLCWCVYFASYIGRLNYSSVMSSIIGENLLSFSQAGSISMVYFFAYGTGQLCNGILGDRLKPQSMIFFGLFCSGISNLFMGLFRSFPAMAVLWGINGYMQSMIWPPIIRIFAEKYTEERKRQCSVDIVSSMAVGTLASYFLSACAMKWISWQAAFYLAAGIMVLIALGWSAGYGAVERFLRSERAAEGGPQGNLSGFSGNGVLLEQEKTAACREETGKEKAGAAAAGKEQAAENGRKQISLPALVAGSGLAGILLPVMIHGVLKDGITQWVPTYIYDCFDVTSSFSVIVTMILPLINLTGAYMARYAGRKHPDEEVRTSVIFFGGALISLMMLLLFGKYHVLLAVLLFAVITASMMAVNTLYVNMIPLHFEKQGRVAAVSGMLNSVAYIGSALSTFTIGIMVEKAGWTVTMAGWAAITAAALGICVVMKKRKFD
ncbi:MFS transporter [Parablautia intestinalis]|uniref:MFS transporter n=1 Tax=Parablautia intestinalis TaxID=2320100 RepID=UPI0023D094C3|nr:MFS transporter [Parablautia intestinalis]MDE7046436.1 MFS transporter [Lachnospiraceae bacterium]